jgi:prepilin-type N-terminal cleavage/methylation domain-containing protein
MSRRGFTLVELLVALTVSAIVLTILASAVRSQGRSTVFQTGQADMQQNVRGALDLFRRELRMAGYGMGEVTEGVLAPLLVPDPGTNQYEVRLRGNFDNVMSRGSAAAGSTTIVLDATAAPFPVFVVGERVSIESAILALAEVREIGSYDQGTGVMGLSGGVLVNAYDPGSFVRQINEVRYVLDADDIFRRANDVIADQLDLLALQYVLLDGTTVANPAGSIADLRAATVSMHSETTAHDGMTPEAELDTEVRIRNLGIVREAS